MLKLKKKKSKNDFFERLVNSEITKEEFLIEYTRDFYKYINKYYRDLQMAHASERMICFMSEKLKDKNLDKSTRQFYSVSKKSFKKLLKSELKSANISRVEAAGSYMIVNKVNAYFGTHYTFADCDRLWRESPDFYDVFKRDKEKFPKYDIVPNSFIVHEQKQYETLKAFFEEDKPFFNKKTYELLVTPQK